MPYRGVILAGGTGSRLLPLTKCINKHVLPVGKKPMIYYAVEKLVAACIERITVVTGLEHAGSVIDHLGSGADFGAKISYCIQDRPGGIAEALGLIESIMHTNERLCVLLGDNIFQASLTEYIHHFSEFDEGAMVLLKDVKDPSRFGVAQVNRMGEIINIEEKPENPKSNLIVTGIYFYDHNVFQIIKNLKPSDRGELEITDVNNYYLKIGKLHSMNLYGFWTDAGCHESIEKASLLVSMHKNDFPDTTL